MALFKNKYRIESSRAQWWDYRNAGAYFVTIKCKNDLHYFGKIRGGKMVFSGLGVIADELWNQIPVRNPHVQLGEFVVMPNHIHGILILVETKNDQGDGADAVETLHATSLQRDTPNRSSQMSRISPLPQSVSTIIRSYKSAVTNHGNRMGFENGWQARFHDRIIRDEAEYNRISDYIRKNPTDWEKN